MAKIRSHQPVMPSLLDRLIDDNPHHALELVMPVSTNLTSYRKSIRRDLENLLNTRLYRQSNISAYPELQKSVVNYGLPDFSTVQFSSAEHREEFRQSLEQTIEQYETRFKRVRVEITQTGEEYDRTLYLKINALLILEPDPVPVLYDSRIHALDRAVTLRELEHG